MTQDVLKAPRDGLCLTERAQIVRALVEWVVVGPAGADIRLRVGVPARLLIDLTAITARSARGGPMREATSIRVRMQLVGPWATHQDKMPQGSTIGLSD
jgi:hypothetical protein